MREERLSVRVETDIVRTVRPRFEYRRVIM